MRLTWHRDITSRYRLSAAAGRTYLSCTEKVARIPDKKWRENKQQLSNAKAGPHHSVAYFPLIPVGTGHPRFSHFMAADSFGAQFQGFRIRVRRLHFLRERGSEGFRGFSTLSAWCAAPRRVTLSSSRSLTRSNARSSTAENCHA